MPSSRGHSARASRNTRYIYILAAWVGTLAVLTALSQQNKLAGQKQLTPENREPATFSSALPAAISPNFTYYLHHVPSCVGLILWAFNTLAWIVLLHSRFYKPQRSHVVDVPSISPQGNALISPNHKLHTVLPLSEGPLTPAQEHFRQRASRKLESTRTPSSKRKDTHPQPPSPRVLNDKADELDELLPQFDVTVNSFEGTLAEDWAHQSAIHLAALVQDHHASSAAIKSIPHASL